MGGNEDYAKELKSSFVTHLKPVVCVDFSVEDEKHFFSGSADKSVKKFELESGKEIWANEAFQGGVLSVKQNPSNEKHLLATSMDSTAKILDSLSGEILQSFLDHSKYVVRGKWSPDGRSFCTAGYDKLVNLYSVDLEGNYKLKESIPFFSIPESVEFTPDSKKLIVGLRDDNWFVRAPLIGKSFLIKKQLACITSIWRLCQRTKSI